MIGIDTSVVVRYLMGTPASQTRRAAAVIDGPDDIGIPLVVLLESAHLLRTQYDVARPDVVGALIDLATRRNVGVLGLPTADTIEALVRARSLPGSPIADAFVAATARWAGAVPLYTFDKGLERHGTPVASP